MSALTITVPREYGYVVLTGVSSVFLLVWQTAMVGGARKAAQVKYPAAYATEEDAAKDHNKMVFNCKQRAHQNTLEAMAIFTPTLFLTGLEYPKFAVASGVLWLTGRVAYTIGYATGVPKNRTRGVWGTAGILGLLLGSAAVAGKWVLEAHK